MRDESLYPLSEHALHRTLRTPPSQPLQAKKPASRFHALVLIGVAAAFRAAVSAHPTKPIVASELAEAKYPAAFPPQWLPVLLATASTSGLPLPIEPYLPNPGCAARYAVNESFPRGNLDAAWGIEVKSNNATIGFLVKSGVNASTSCDQLAAIVIDEETNEEQIIGVSTLVENRGYQLAWFGSEGEEIRFRYWDGEAEEEYFGLERFIMKSGDAKKARKKCKKNCDAKPNLCPACEDNTIPGFGTSWCKMNVGAAGFCTDGDGKTKCKKTCGLCR